MGTFSDGRSFAVNESGQVVPRGDVPSVLRTISFEPSQLPDMDGVFVNAARVSSWRTPAGLHRGYLGVWRTRRRCTVAAFSVDPAGNAAAARAVLSSREPILGVAYFPAPDTNSGRVGIVQKTSARAVRLLGFNWSHDGWFIPAR
jgi:hypothetical protein